MALFVFASAWYAAVIGLVVGSVRLGARRRKAAETATPDETYEDRRRRDRAAHLARLREEELAELRRAAAHRRRPDLGARA